ncbi:hypothetical protein [Thermococcus sp.]|uniref:hypothetical protein n=1 Tax=Thermococcus sp. TaxID=35749 RepID=UPI002623F804|nr:hypothetical protein [Thermococcus sp.]
MRKLLALVLVGILVLISGCLGSPPVSPTHQSSTTYSPQSSSNVTHFWGFPTNASNVSSSAQGFLAVEATLERRKQLLARYK